MGGLVLSRKKEESLTINEIVDGKIVSTITILITDLSKHNARLRIEAPERFNIRRSELPERTQQPDDGGPESPQLLRGTGTPDEESPPVPHVPDLRRLGITTPLKALENDARPTETTAE